MHVSVRPKSPAPVPRMAAEIPFNRLFMFLTANVSLWQVGQGFLTWLSQQRHLHHERQATRARTTSQLVDEWHKPEVQDAIESLILYCRANGGAPSCAQRWAERKLQGDAEALRVDGARRAWLATLTKWSAYYNSSMVLETVLEDIPGRARAESALDYLEPFEEANCRVILGKEWRPEAQPGVFTFLRIFYKLPGPITAPVRSPSLKEALPLPGTRQEVAKGL